MKRNTMMTLLWAAVFAFALLVPMNCGCTYVKAGYVGVKVYTLGGKKGDFEVLGVGRHWEGINEDIYLFPTFTQNKVWTADKREDSPDDEHFTFQSKEGVSIEADVGMSYSLNADKIVTLFQTYRKDINAITEVYLRSYVRDALNQNSSQYTVEEINGKGKTDLISSAEKSVRDKLVDKGIVLERLYWVNSPRPPSNVIAEINNKVAAVQIAQRRENEVQAAEAQAKINRLNNGSMSSMTIKMKELDNQAAAIQRWNGQLPQTMPPGSTLPFLDVKNTKD